MLGRLFFYRRQSNCFSLAPTRSFLSSPSHSASAAVSRTLRAPSSSSARPSPNPLPQTRAESDSPAVPGTVHPLPTGPDAETSTKSCKKPSNVLPFFSKLPTIRAAVLQAKGATTIASLIKSSPNIQRHLSNGKKLNMLVGSLVSEDAIVCRQTLVALHQLDFPLKQSLFETMTSHHIPSKRWSDVLEAVDLGMKLTGATTRRLLSARLLALIETQHYALLDTVLDDFKHFSINPDRRTFHLLIDGYIRNRDLARARSCMQTMRSAGCPPDSFTHAKIAQAYRYLGSDPTIHEMTLNILPEVHRRSTQDAVLTVNRLLQMRLDVNDTEEALNLLNLFSSESMASIVPILANATQDSWPIPLHCPVSFMPPLQPNARTFSVLIDFMGRQKNPTMAVAIARHMLATGVKPDEATVVALIRALGSVGDVENAAEIVLSMKSPPSALKAFLEGWRPYPRRRINALDLSQVPITTKVVNALLRPLMHFRGFRFFKHTVRVMRASSLQPDSRTLEILLHKLASLHKPHEVLRALRLFTEPPKVSLTLRHFHPLLRALLAVSKRQIHGSGWRSALPSFPHPHRYLMDNYGPEDPFYGLVLPRNPPPVMLTHARPLISILQSRGVRSDPKVFGYRMRYEALVKGDFASARQVFDAMLQRGMYPAPYHFHILMEGHAFAGDPRGAEQVMHEARKFGMKAGVVMFTLLILAFARAHRPAESLRVFKEMVSAGIRPDVPSVHAVCLAFWGIKAVPIARQFLLAFWPAVAPFPSHLEDAQFLDLLEHFRRIGIRNMGKRMTKADALMFHAQLTVIMNDWAKDQQKPTEEPRRRERSFPQLFKHIRPSGRDPPRRRRDRRP